MTEAPLAVTYAEREQRWMRRWLRVATIGLAAWGFLPVHDGRRLLWTWHLLARGGMPTFVLLVGVPLMLALVCRSASRRGLRGAPRLVLWVGLAVAILTAGGMKPARATPWWGVIGGLAAWTLVMAIAAGSHAFRVNDAGAFARRRVVAGGILLLAALLLPWAEGTSLTARVLARGTPPAVAAAVYALMAYGFSGALHLLPAITADGIARGTSILGRILLFGGPILLVANAAVDPRVGDPWALLKVVGLVYGLAIPAAVALTARWSPIPEEADLRVLVDYDQVFR